MIKTMKEAAELDAAGLEALHEEIVESLVTPDHLKADNRLIQAMRAIPAGESETFDAILIQGNFGTENHVEDAAETLTAAVLSAIKAADGGAWSCEVNDLGQFVVSHGE